MTPKEFQKSNLAVELKAGRKRLESLHGLRDEQCERPGATLSGSVVDLLSEIVTKEFLALMEVSDRLPSSLMNLLANTDGRTPSVSGAEKDATNKSVETLLAEFGVLRSAVIRSHVLVSVSGILRKDLNGRSPSHSLNLPASLSCHREYGDLLVVEHPLVSLPEARRRKTFGPSLSKPYGMRIYSRPQRFFYKDVTELRNRCVRVATATPSDEPSPRVGTR